MIEGGEFNKDWLIKVDRLNFTYPDSNRRILNNVSFEIKVGDRIWIRGKNSTGKTTLLKLLSSDLESDSVEYADGLKIAKVDQKTTWTEGMVKEVFYQLERVDKENFKYF
ncbi:ATP-binding cassette domain-containing protein [Zhenhengia yiwuensis]|uniref:ATP-binding cassette domain-containing protein n=1 Tax=Zhenhengia yiwuensis TaxID=2763666 RepID=A0A926IEG2_9FIRM|nr:ATP-binding cassette domain-containing protein [Zhenhengia yiwuensis]